jgi:CRP-like cAMP-binding protein
MESKIIDYIQNIVALTVDEAKLFETSFKEVRIKKKQFIVQPNYITKQRNYVVKGAFRAYVVADEGQDHTINFAIDEWWITDYNSFIFQQPATMFVVALEDSVILQIDFETEQELKKSNHKFETFFRIIAERGLASQQRRIVSNLTQTAEERYENYTKMYPHVIQRVPQYALASYLGMTTEYLSKLRNHKVSAKKLK